MSTVDGPTNFLKKWVGHPIGLPPPPPTVVDMVFVNKHTNCANTSLATIGSKTLAGFLAMCVSHFTPSVLDIWIICRVNYCPPSSTLRESKRNFERKLAANIKQLTTLMCG